MTEKHGKNKAFLTTKALVVIFITLLMVSFYGNLYLWSFESTVRRKCSGIAESCCLGLETISPLEKKFEPTRARKLFEGRKVLNSEALKILGKNVKKLLEEHQLRHRDQVKTCNVLAEGFSCTIHTLSFCIFQALAQNQSFRIGFKLPDDPKKRNLYLSRDAYESAFLQLPNSGNVSLSRRKRDKYANRKADFNVKARNRTELLAIPPHIREKVNFLHPNPFAWWMGQTASYIMRLKPELEGKLLSFRQNISSSPVVGLHIRRTDKLQLESDSFQLEEYMVIVERWFRRHELAERLITGNENFTTPRRILLATEDPCVIEEAKQKYPFYKILYDGKAVETAKQPSSRHSPEAVIGVVMDINRLVACDYVVCTFSSNVCRLVYELMQAKYGDATDRLYSIDIQYNYQWYPQPLYHHAILPHNSTTVGSMKLEIGDRILSIHKDTHSNKWFGVNLRTKHKGNYPEHKVVPEFLVF